MQRRVTDSSIDVAARPLTCLAARARNASAGLQAGLLLSEVDATTQKLLQTPEVSANGFTEIDGQ